MRERGKEEDLGELGSVILGMDWLGEGGEGREKERGRGPCKMALTRSSIEGVKISVSMGIDLI